MKAAAIGTIMPWTGEISTIPAGWKSCNGDSIKCEDYPLLARVIRDTYGGTNVDFSDSNFIFPYTGYANAFINLPNLNQRGIADIDYNYFGSNAPGPQDTLIARNIVDDYIGTSSVINANLALVDNFQAITDVNFTLGTTAMTGNVSGQTLLPGQGSKTVYTIPRKLGRNHFPSHSHPTPLTTVITNDQGTPGLGPGIYSTDSVPIQASLYGSIYGDWFRNTNTDWDEPSNPFSNGPGRYILASMNGGELMNNYKPITTQTQWHGIKEWFTNTLKSKGRTATGTIINSSARIWDGWINTGDVLPFGDSAAAVATPNFDPGGGTIGGVSVPGSDLSSIGAGGDGHPVLFDHAARSFTTNDPNSSPNNHIFAHQHEDFEVKFNQQSLRIDDTVAVDVSTGGADPLTPNNIPSAFVIDWQVQTASLSTLYLIRAY